MYLFNRKIFKKENYDEALELIKKLVDESQKEEGCIIYDVYRDCDNELGLCIYEEWEGQEYLSAHQESAHFKELVPKIGALAEEKSPVYKFEKL
ncbi:putative quinol monooxygenase [Anaerosphaera multitolerans]|uniref:Antibiotic biosynthesis monooxygenase n=1 Tax=Anaerosphaera multitolerans TaxID=2487351 RepID=A0A437S975_9FIRM|nr:putative quinol monooxygenase [Anaerosphaera multitolerans]RVU55552.1 antibiotic biosynthesis monooxygenase [Anaerosphaera multitolerans]